MGWGNIWSWKVSFESGFETKPSYLPPSLPLPNPSLFHLLPPRSCCMRVARTIYIYIYIVERGWRAAADPPHNFFPIDPDSAIVFPGAEGELQLRSVLPAGEWESRKVLGRGTSPRRLSVQRARRILGGKILLYLSLSICIYIYILRRVAMTEEASPLGSNFHP